MHLHERLVPGLLIVSCLVAAGIAVAGCAARGGPAATDKSPSGSTVSNPSGRIGDAYYLGTCALCDGLLGAKGESVDAVWRGRDLRFCSAACAERFNGDPVRWSARLDGVLVADQLPHYPLRTSIVSGATLPGEPVDAVIGNRLFRVADDAERAAVVAEPKKYFEILDAAVIAAQSPTYGMPNKCPVQGDILPTDVPQDIVVANRMVRVCCGRCVEAVRARPSRFLPLIDVANREAAH